MVCKILSFDDRPKPSSEFGPTPGRALLQFDDALGAAIAAMRLSHDEREQVPA